MLRLAGLGLTRWAPPSRRGLAYIPREQLPFRIRVPLAKLKASKKASSYEHVAGALGDGEALEGDAAEIDYLSLALRSRVYDLMAETQLQHAPALSEALGALVHIKREDSHETFTFFQRCAVNELAQLSPAAKAAGAVTASIGSRGHALAWAADRLGIALTVVVPTITPTSRRDAVRRCGAEVVVAGDSMTEAKEAAAALASEGGLVTVGDHDAPAVIAACGTVGLEVLRQHGPAVLRDGRRGAAPVSHAAAATLDAVFVGVGGGSLLGGIAAAIKSTSPSTKVIGVEPRSADVLSRSLLTGHRVAVDTAGADTQGQGQGADGIFVTQIGPEVFRLCDALVDEVVLVDDAEVTQALRDTFLDTRAVLEPAGAVAIAGLKKYAAAQRPVGGRRPAYVAVGSDASNLEFDFLHKGGT